MLWTFRSPKEVHHGEGSLDKLSDIIEDEKKAFIVTDKPLRKTGNVDKVIEKLEECEVETKIFDEVEPDPSIQTVKNVAKAMRDYNPDILIGVGGGSTLDTAKSAWPLFQDPEMDIYGVNLWNPIKRKIKFVNIPTTSGTGAELTYGMVLTDKEKGKKVIMTHYDSIPDAIIVDPDLTKTMPPELTASTGFDALAHAIEAFSVTNKNDYSDAMSLYAIKLIFRWLQKAYENPDDMEAREHMHNAATIAGYGFGNSLAGAGHSLGHAAGAVFHEAHGKCVGIALPFYIQFNCEDNEAEKCFAEIARELNLEFDSNSEGADKLVEEIGKLMEAVDFPESLKDLGVSEEELEENLKFLARHAKADMCTDFNRRDVSIDEFKKLFKYMWEGKKVDF